MNFYTKQVVFTQKPYLHKAKRIGRFKTVTKEHYS